MPISMLFWLIYIIALIFSIWGYYPGAGGTVAYRPLGGSLLFFVLVGLLGWHDFGFPIHG